MKNYLNILAILTVFSTVVFTSLEAQKPNNLKPSKVELKSVDGQYHFFVNGKIFDVKGVGGFENFSLLKSSGGNTIRTWSAQQGMNLLDSARKYNLMVAMGLSMGQELHGFDYNDSVAVAKQFERIKREVDSLKNNPNILCWVAGNELNLVRGKLANPKCYDALKQIVDYIHKTDPNHPVTTTFAGATPSHVQLALEHCPDLDFISLQLYGGLGRIEGLAKNCGITKPYMATEFGPNGQWERPKTSWGREIEETSTEKADGIAKRIQDGLISNKSGLCLGGFAFLWGHKQERTPTWYSMILKTGESTATVDELTKYWTGKYPSNRAPRIDSMRLDGKKATDNVNLEPGKNYSAIVAASDPENDPLSFKWEILSEVSVRGSGGSQEVEPEVIKFDVVSSDKGDLKFIAPASPGEYRLFVYVFDGKKKVATANIPFLIKEKQ